MPADLPPPDVVELLRPTLSPAGLVLVGGGALLYLGGVRRLRARGRHWSRGRTACFLGGLAAVAGALCSGLARYDTVLFSAHMGQHLLLGMVAPLLLALGAPITLALQASQRSTTVALLGILHHPVVRAVSAPVVVWAVFGGTLVALYFTPLYEASLRNDLVHASVHVHFLAVGFLFCSLVVAVDPWPRTLSAPARLLVVAIAIPVHAFIGVALLSATTPLAADWYAAVAPTWAGGALDDQRLGAGMLWASGELFSLSLLAIVFFRWASAEVRAGRRLDRALDDEHARAVAAT